MARRIRRMSFLALCLSVTALAGCNHPALSKRPDFSKLQPDTEWCLELSDMQKSGRPVKVLYTGTVSRVKDGEVTLVEARCSENEGVLEPVGTISIPLDDVKAITPQYRDYQRFRSG